MKRAARSGLAVLVLLVVGLLLWPEARPGPTGGWMAAAGLEPRFATVGGLRVRYVEQGSGPAVVLLHGFGSSIYTWKDVLPALARTGRVVALDFPGFGGSDRPPDLSFDMFPGVVLGLLAQLAIREAALVGNSMGGAVAVVIAARQPERVPRLVLIDAAGYNTGPGQRPWNIDLVSSRAAGALLDRLPLRGPLVRLGLQQVFYDDALVTPERVDEYLAPLLRPGTSAAIRSLMVTRTVRPSLVAELAPQVKAPTLILWGRQDRWIPVAQADRFASAIPGSRKVILDGCGHLPEEERPDEVIRLLTEFLGTHHKGVLPPAPATSARQGMKRVP